MKQLIENPESTQIFVVILAAILLVVLVMFVIFLLRRRRPKAQSYDEMEGHEFEYFCADLLEKRGFEEVEVTKGSGDYGVDILAEKDGVTYAIQCKRYEPLLYGNALFYYISMIIHCYWYVKSLFKPLFASTLPSCSPDIRHPTAES